MAQFRMFRNREVTETDEQGMPPEGTAMLILFGLFAVFLIILAAAGHK